MDHCPTLNFFNLIQNFMGQVGNVMGHVENFMGHVGNFMGQARNGTPWDRLGVNPFWDKSSCKTSAKSYY